MKVLIVGIGALGGTIAAVQSTQECPFGWQLAVPNPRECCEDRDCASPGLEETRAWFWSMLPLLPTMEKGTNST